VTTTPIPCANRLGGPGTNFGLPRKRGAKTRCANQPSGLSFGPVSTRATNPYAIGTSSQYQPVARTSAQDAATTAATVRAAFSFTGFGKPRREAIAPR